MALVNGLLRARDAAHESNRVSGISSCFKNTRTGVLRDIRDWIMGKDSKPVFWLNGMAGIGKTTITRTIVEQKEDIWIASFFFSRDNTEASNPLFVFPTLAYQLASRHRQLMPKIAKMIQANADCTNHPLSKQVSEFIVDPLKELGNSDRTVLFVLDALDECSSKEGASHILQLLLTHAPSVPCNIRILVTSRPEKHIHRVFDKDGNQAKIVLHDIEREIVNSDIDKYVRHELASIFKGLPPPDGNDIVHLVESSDNLFIHAATALRFIGDSTVDDPQGQLSIILGSQQDPDAKPYSALDHLYLQVLAKAIPDNEATRGQVERRIGSVIGVIVMLREPLPVTTLVKFVGTDRKSTRLNSSHSGESRMPSSA